MTQNDLDTLHCVLLTFISQRETQNLPCSQIVFVYKQRSARRGKHSSAKRVAARRERANRAYAQWRVVEIEMGALVKSSRMTAAIQLYHGRLPQLRGRLKSPTERWLQSLWRRLMIQQCQKGAICDRQTVAASDQN